MNRTVLWTLLIVAGPGTLNAQGACPPEESDAAFVVEWLVTRPEFEEDLTNAGLPDLTLDEVKVLSSPEDGELCAALLRWAIEHQTSKPVPQRRWAFYRANDRYIAIRWNARSPAGGG